MHRLPLAIALLLAAPLAYGQVYKWKDAQGTMHYSESPPPTGTKYSQLAAPAGGTPSGLPATARSAPAPATTAAAPSPAMPAHAGSVADTPQNRTTLCKSLEANMSTLKGSGPVVMQQGSTQQVLTADQRAQQLATAGSQYKQYCGK